MKAVLLYNVILLVADIIFLFVVARKRKSWEVITVMTVCLLTAAVLGVIVGQTEFEALSLYAYAVFLHGTICLAGLGAISWADSRRTGVAFLGFALLLLVLAADGFLVEPHWLEVSTVEIRSDKLERAIKVVVVADLQTDEIGPFEKRVLDRVMAENPDLILLTGDYVQAEGPEIKRLTDELRFFLQEIEFGAPLGVYAVRGNIDRQGWTESFRDLPVTVFAETRSIETRYFDLTGLSDGDSANPKMKVDGRARFHIAMGHRPDFAMGEVDADLLIAGHTHGGQVQVPFFGPVTASSRVPRRWASGVTKLDGNRTLVVSRGIGMERSGSPEIRLFCRPELVVLHLAPSKGSTALPSEHQPTTSWTTAGLWSVSTLSRRPLHRP